VPDFYESVVRKNSTETIRFDVLTQNQRRFVANAAVDTSAHRQPHDAAFDQFDSRFVPVKSKEFITRHR